MGLLSWLFPTADDRVAAAKKYVAQKNWAEARLEVLDLDRDDARRILEQAEHELAKLNLDAAVSWARAGDDRRVQVHMEMAENFHKGGLEEEFRAARREMRELRKSRSEQEERAKREKEAKQMAADPLGLTGGASWLQAPVDEGLYDPEREEIEARVALIVEGYPESLRGGVRDLGADFAKAVIDLEEGRADRALQALLALDDANPLVRWERARCCHMLGDPKATAREIKAFAERAGGHHDMGRQHSVELLAQVLTEEGNPKEALRVLRNARATEPDRGGFLFAQLLFMTGELTESETVLTDMIRKHPRTQPLYMLLAQVRLAGGHRVQAMRALEASQEAVCCTPGKCGSQKPDPNILRTLATLYLEDGIETERAYELADQAFSLIQRPQWGDVYLKALVAKAQRAPDAEEFAQRVRTITPADHPAFERVAAHLAG